MALWASSKLNTKIIEYLNEDNNFLTELKKNLISIIENIEKQEWNNAKAIWVFDICNLSNDVRIDKSGTTLTLDTFGTEYTFFYTHISPLQRFRLREECKNCQILKKFNQSYLYFVMDNNTLNLNVQSKKPCIKCGHDLLVGFQFEENTWWLFLEIDLKLNLSVSDLPKTLVVNNLKYSLLCATYLVQTQAHFKADF